MKLRDKSALAAGLACIAASPLLPASSAAARDVVINEIRIEQSGADDDEYFELKAAPDTPLDGLTYLVIGDGASELGSGVIEEMTDLTGCVIGPGGHFLAAESSFTLGTPDLVTSLNFENSDNVTHLLVQDFTGDVGDDLDTDDDGLLDVEPWTAVLDAIALVEEDNPPSGTEYHYGYLGDALGPDDADVPGHAYRCEPDAIWTIGVVDPLGETDTPGTLNKPCGGQPIDAIINEIRIDQPGSNFDEYFELKGTPDTALDTVTYLVLGDAADGDSGVIEAVVDLTGQVIGPGGHFLAAEDTFTLATPDLVTELNFENGDNVTHLLVREFTGSDGDDLDTDDDGVLDLEPWAETLDIVALLVSLDEPPIDTEWWYGQTTVGPDGDQVPAQVYRCEPDGIWTIGVADPADPDETDTPGELNEPCVYEPIEVVLNEIRIDQPSSDTDEYFELKGTPDGALNGLTYVVIGDTDETDSGILEAAIDLSGQFIGPDGYFVAAEDTFSLAIPDLVTELPFENEDNVTHLLVKDFAGAEIGDDLDAEDDGLLDFEPWSEIVDAVAVISPLNEDLYYSDTTVGPDGGDVPSQVYRCEPDGTWTVGVADPDDPNETDTPGEINVECGAGPDSDGDGIPDADDNCPYHFNPDQLDCDEDGMGDVCAIADAYSQDCNDNDIPDECDLVDHPEWDADGDGLIDDCYLEPPAGLLINEIRTDQPAADNDEYFELKGIPSTGLDGVHYIVIGDAADGDSGVIEAVINLKGLAIPADGHFLAVEDTYTLGSIFDAEYVLSGDVNLMNFENSDNVTHMIVANFFGGKGRDLDADDDGQFDDGAPCWLHLLDSVALVENLDQPPTDTEWWYGDTIVGPDDGFVPGHVYRCQPDQDWLVGPFDPDDPDAADTPGDTNPDCPPDCPADITGDGVVDVLDLLAVLAAWGDCPGCIEDITGDDVVDVLDLLEVLASWGPC